MVHEGSAARPRVNAAFYTINLMLPEPECARTPEPISETLTLPEPVPASTESVSPVMSWLPDPVEECS